MDRAKCTPSSRKCLPPGAKSSAQCAARNSARFVPLPSRPPCTRSFAAPLSSLIGDLFPRADVLDNADEIMDSASIGALRRSAKRGVERRGAPVGNQLSSARRGTLISPDPIPRREDLFTDADGALDAAACVSLCCRRFAGRLESTCPCHLSISI